MSLATATRLGPYEIIAPIGAGGMGEVYKTRDTRLHRDVAVKILPEFFAADSDRLRRFQAEAQAAGALNHPNVLTIYDIGISDGIPYLVSELLEGESLSERLKRGKLSLKRAVDYGRQIADGLAAAHARGITHRDIKPANIFITKDGRAKILDFGIAKLASPQSTDQTMLLAADTSTGIVMGTAAYMSPEQARGQNVDQRSDIFSLGCVLYEMVIGTAPFHGATSADLMSAILREEPDVNAIPSPAFRRIVAHCLEKVPEQRFQAALDVAFDLEAINEQDSGPQLAAQAGRSGAVRSLLAVAAALACACLLFAYFAFRPRPIETFHRLTFRRGIVHAARFTPDGYGIVYSAKWEDEPSEVFAERLDAPGSRGLGFPGTELLSISSKGELALLQNARVLTNGFAVAGLLCRAPLAGGAPRPMEDKIDFSDWSPDEDEMAVVRETQLGTQLEYPYGKVLYRTAGYISEPRISRDGASIAFIDHPLANDNAGSVAVIDRAGGKKTLSTKYLAAQGLAWSPQGNEIWFSAAKTGARFDLRAVSLRGRERVLLSTPASIILMDVSKDGRVLIANSSQRIKLLFRGPADKAERELSWLDWSLLWSLSPDSKYVAFFESGEGAGSAELSYLRDTNGAPAVLLGNGADPTLSMNGQSVVVYGNDPPAIVIYPVGPGQAQRVALPGFTLAMAGLTSDEKHIWFNGNRPSQGRRYYTMDLEGGTPRPLTAEGVRSTTPGLVLNGKFLTGTTGDKLYLYPIDGGEPDLPKGIQSGDRVAGWSEDGKSLFVYARNEFPYKVYRLDRSTGKRDLLLEVTPSDRAGVTGRGTVLVTPDAKSYAYSVNQQLSELQLVDGLK